MANVKALISAFGVSKENILDALGVTPEKLIPQLMETGNTYEAFVAAGILIPKKLLHIYSAEEQNDNEKKWNHIQLIFNSLPTKRTEANLARGPYKKLSAVRDKINSDRDAFRALLNDENIPYFELGKMYDVSGTTIRYLAASLGFNLPKRSRGKKIGIHTKNSSFGYISRKEFISKINEDPEKFKKLLADPNITLKSIARLYNAAPPEVSVIPRKLGFFVAERPFGANWKRKTIEVPNLNGLNNDPTPHF